MNDKRRGASRQRMAKKRFPPLKAMELSDAGRELLAMECPFLSEGAKQGTPGPLVSRESRRS